MIAVFLLLLTGARIANMLAMRWDELDLDSEKPHWLIPSTKSGYPQDVPLVIEAVDILKHRRENAGESPWVFPAEGRAKYSGNHMSGIKSGWNRIMARTEFKGLRIHDLRRTNGSFQVDEGASLPVIGRSLGHRNPSTTQIYARLSTDPVRESLQRAAHAMLAAAREVPKSETDESPTPRRRKR